LSFYTFAETTDIDTTATDFAYSARFGTLSLVSFDFSHPYIFWLCFPQPRFTARKQQFQIWKQLDN